MRHAPADDFTLIEDLFIFHIRMQHSKALGYGKEHHRAVAREDLRTAIETERRTILVEENMVTM